MDNEEKCKVYLSDMIDLVDGGRRLDYYQNHPEIITTSAQGCEILTLKEVEELTGKSYEDFPERFSIRLN